MRQVGFHLAYIYSNLRSRIIKTQPKRRPHVKVRVILTYTTQGNIKLIFYIKPDMP